MSAGEKNMFAMCDTTDQLIGMAIGAGSACWTNLRAAGEFKSTEASEIVDHAQQRLAELIAKELISE